jgi:hypothetical protein
MGNKSQYTFEKTFAAAAFAEAGEHDTAIRMADVTDKPKRLLDKLLQGFQNHMTAVAFAESGEVEEARRLVGKKETRYIQKENTLAGFLEKVGLEGAHISYGFVPIST